MAEITDSCECERGAEDEMAMQRWSLMFNDPSKEAAYLIVRKKTLSRNFLVACCVWIVISVVTGVRLHLSYEHDQLNIKNPVALTKCALLMMILFAICVIAIVGGLSRKGIASFRFLEGISLFTGLVYVVLRIFGNQYSTARMFNESPAQVWGRSHFTDSTLLLDLDLVITAAHIFLPIRNCISWIIPMCAVLVYTFRTLLLGGPELTYTGYQLCGRLMILGMLSWLGQRATEIESRSSFAKQEKLRIIAENERREMVQERVMRYTAQRELESQIDQYSRSGSLGQSGSSITRSGHKDPGHSLPSISEGASEISFTLSASEASVSNKHKVDEKESQTDLVKCEDKATNPLLSWGKDGWTCQRCSKPPPALSPAIDRESKLDPSLIRKKRQRKGNSSSGSSSCNFAGEVSPQVSTFRLTPRKTQMIVIQDALATWNCARGGQNSCCPFHNAAKQAAQTFGKLLKLKCDPLWTPYSEAQCSHCFAMTDCLPDPDELCSSCGFPFWAEDPSSEQFANISGDSSNILPSVISL